MRRFVPLLLVVVAFAVPSSAETVLQAWAYVNLVDNPPRQVSNDGTPVHQQASGEGSSASAHASETSVGANAFSEDGVLSEGASATASASSTFRATTISGASGTIPLTFNVAVTGSIYSTSSLLPSNGPNVSVSEVTIRSNVDSAEMNGSLLLGSQDGALVLVLPSGFLNTGGEVEDYVVGDVVVRLANPLDAIPFDLLPELEVDTIVGKSVADVAHKIDLLINSIRQTADAVGFPHLNIPPGKVVPVFVATYQVNDQLPLTVPIVLNDGRPHNLALSIIVEASSSPVATASADYANTVELRSVTVDPSYRGNPDDIVITFESGAKFHATRAMPPRHRAVRH